MRGDLHSFSSALSVQVVMITSQTQKESNQLQIDNHSKKREETLTS
jgi:hypothetical protein